MDDNTRYVDAEIDVIDDEQDTANDTPMESPGRPVVPALVAMSLIIAGLLLTWWLSQNIPGVQAQERKAHIDRMIAEHDCADGETVQIVDYGTWYKLACERGQHGSE